MDSFRVYTRCRPLNEQQTNYGLSRKSVTIVDATAVSVSPNDGSSKQHIFQLDGVFDENITNNQIFQQAIIPLIENIMNGINSTVFAYGITGAGKSFTMFGKNGFYQDQNQQMKYACTEKSGIIPLTFQYLMNLCKQQVDTKIKMSYLQIYNQQVFDLLQPTQTNLQLSQDPVQGVVVHDLKQIDLMSFQHSQELIAMGNSKRVIAQTKANQVSSRSHAIVIINLQRRIEDSQQFYTSKLSLVDLAGSEKQSVHSETRGIRTFQGSNINRSLLTLGNCINMLSQKRKLNPANINQAQFIPYRDSKLTRLLKDSLGGNTKTVMIACISTSSLCYQQTVNTLKYACRANKIEKVVHQNIRDNKNMQQYKKQITNLKKQNQILKMNLNMSLMMPNLNIGFVEQQTKMKKIRTKQLLTKLTKAIEERMEIMMDQNKQQQQKMQLIQKLVTLQQQTKTLILQQFEIKNIKNPSSSNNHKRKISKLSSQQQQIQQIKNPNIGSNVNQKTKQSSTNVTKQSLTEYQNVQNQRKMTDSITAQSVNNVQINRNKVNARRVSNSVKKTNKNVPNTNVHAKNNYSKYKISLKQDNKLAAKYVQQQQAVNINNQSVQYQSDSPLVMNVQKHLQAFQQKQHPQKHYPLINLQNLRKKVMQDKKQMQNFKKQIQNGSLTHEQIHSKAAHLLSMGQISALRFSQDQKQYLIKLVNGNIITSATKASHFGMQTLGNQTPYSENRKKMEHISINKNLLTQASQTIQNLLQKNNGQNSRNRHLKSLNRIISMARVNKSYNNHKNDHYYQAQMQQCQTGGNQNKAQIHNNNSKRYQNHNRSSINVYGNQNVDAQYPNKSRHLFLDSLNVTDNIHNLSCINRINSNRNIKQNNGSNLGNKYQNRSCNNSYINIPSMNTTNNDVYDINLAQIQTINNSYELQLQDNQNINQNVHVNHASHFNNVNASKILQNIQQDYTDNYYEPNNLQEWNQHINIHNVHTQYNIHDGHNVDYDYEDQNAGYPNSYRNTFRHQNQQHYNSYSQNIN